MSRKNSPVPQERGLNLEGCNPLTEVSYNVGKVEVPGAYKDKHRQVWFIDVNPATRICYTYGPSYIYTMKASLKQIADKLNGKKKTIKG